MLRWRLVWSCWRWWPTAWDKAAAAWAADQRALSASEALLHAAEAALAGGDRDGATERLRVAGALAAGLGAEPLAQEIALLARRGRIVLETSFAARRLYCRADRA